MSSIKGKDIYKAIGNINKRLVVEAEETDVKKKSIRLSERLVDNLACVAIVCLLVLTVCIVQVVIRNGGNTHKDTPVNEPSSTEQNDIIVDETYIYEDATVVSTECEYVYSKDNKVYIVSKEGSYVSADSWDAPKSGEIVFSDDLLNAFGNNAIITPENSKDVAYLVEIHVYDVLDNAGNKQLTDDGLEAEYERVNRMSELDIKWAGKPSYDIESNRMYGVLTVEQMREYPTEAGRGYVFGLISKTELKYEGNIDELLYGKDYSVVNVNSQDK